MKRKRIAAGFTGPSGSGKTTLILKLNEKLIAEGGRVVVVKTDSRQHADFGDSSKDSTRFFESGADVLVASPAKTVMFSHGEASLDDLIDMAGDFDYLLIEGLRRIVLPRIAIFRESIEPDYLDFASVVAAGPDIDKKTVPPEYKIIDLNSVEKIIEWINLNGKRCD